MSGSLAIEPLRTRHLRSVATIDAASYPQPWSRELWRAELRRTDRIYLAALERHDVVGYAGGLIALGDVHIMTIAAHPQRRGEGIATRLLLALLDEAIEAGCTAATLEVRESNIAAQSLYARFGMTPAGVRRGYYEPDGEDAMVMWVHAIDCAEYRALLGTISQKLEDAA